MRLRVDGVVVPPLQAGVAFAHARDGRCVTFTGPRDAMVRLCQAHREHNLGLRPPVFVDSADWAGVAPVANSADCWIHEFVKSDPFAA
jgi:hypothetical protein